MMARNFEDDDDDDGNIFLVILWQLSWGCHEFLSQQSKDKRVLSANKKWAPRLFLISRNNDL